MGQAMLSISLIQFSGLNTAVILLRGLDHVPSLSFDLRPNYGRGNDDDDLLQNDPDNHNGVIKNLEPDILEWEVKRDA